MWKQLWLFLTLQKKIENENATLKQAQIDEIKWFVCF
jgi:hypothetical protein